jgi:hypothetical protein
MSQDSNQLRIIWSIFLVVVAAALFASGVLLFIQATWDLNLAIEQDAGYKIPPLLILLVKIAVIVFFILLLLFRIPWFLVLVFLIVLVGLIFAFPPEKIPPFVRDAAEFVKAIVTFALSFVAFALAGWTIVTLIRRHLRLALTLIGFLLIAVIAVKTHLLQQ